MKISVRLFGLLALQSENSQNSGMIELETSSGTTFQDVATKLNLPPGGAYMFSVGGILKMPAECVQDGDEVQIFSPLAGG